MYTDISKIIDEADAWLEIDGVEMVAQGEQEGEVCISVHCSCDPGALAGRIPETFKGYPVVIEQTGPYYAQNDGVS